MSGKNDVWMPLFIADYLADTTHLSAAQHGAYLLLIMAYWRSGPLPNDDKLLSRIARCDGRQWSTFVGATVREFFDLRDGKLHHRRIDEELAKAAAISETRRQAGRQSRANRAPVEPELPPANGANGRPNDQDPRTSLTPNLCTSLTPNLHTPSLHSPTSNGLISLETGQANAPAFAEHLQTHARDARARASQSQSQSPVSAPLSSPRKPRRSDPPEAWAHFAEGWEVDRRRGGVNRPVVNGEYIDTLCDCVCEAAGISDPHWQGDFETVVAWLKDGLDGEPIVEAIRSVASRDRYQPPSVLRYFDRAVREWRTK